MSELSALTGSDHDRNRSVRRATQLQAVTIAWMIVEASISLVAGIAARSLLLIAFGADSVIELVSAGVVFWRLGSETGVRGGDPSDIEAVERRASRICGRLLYVLSAYVVLQAVYGLTHRRHADTTFPGIVVAVVAAVGMPILARAKLRAAEDIGSGALRADAMETFTCGSLAWILLAGLVANALLHWWWLDAASSLVIVPLLLKEAKEAITGECGCQAG